jgi:hypothetical protein
MCCSTAPVPSWSARRCGPSLIDSFTVGSGERLTAVPGSPFPAQGLGPFGSEFRPANPDQLFMSNARNTATDSGTVPAFKDRRNGRQSSIAGPPFPDHQMAPCWVEITQDGRFLSPRAPHRGRSPATGSPPTARCPCCQAALRPAVPTPTRRRPAEPGRRLPVCRSGQGQRRRRTRRHRRQLDLSSKPGRSRRDPAAPAWRRAMPRCARTRKSAPPAPLRRWPAISQMPAVRAGLAITPHLQTGRRHR